MKILRQKCVYINVFEERLCVHFLGVEALFTVVLASLLLSSSSVQRRHDLLSSLDRATRSVELIFLRMEEIEYLLNV